MLVRSRDNACSNVSDMFMLFRSRDNACSIVSDTFVLVRSRDNGCSNVLVFLTGAAVRVTPHYSEIQFLCFRCSYLFYEFSMRIIKLLRFKCH